jgi:hypothetical protein
MSEVEGMDMIEE